jgi:CubicO group peptidase (beta-lactamase class C family)
MGEHHTMTCLPRRDFLKFATGAFALPALSLSPAAGQLAVNPPKLPEVMPAERAAMAKLALAFMEKYDVPALSFAIGYGGEIIHADAFGFADRERSEPVSPARRFRIASVSKMLTSAAIFSLIEQGRITLSDYVFGPGAVLGTDFGRPPYSAGIDQITLEHLLMHTAGGWANGRGDPMFRPPNLSHFELIAWVLADRPLDHPPGTTHAYSNFGYCVLGRVIEKLTRRPYGDYIRGQILNRCGVTEMTIAGNTLEQRQSGEVKYYAQGGENPYGMNVRRMDSHGGWIARPADVVNFLMHIDGYAKPPNILKPDTIRTMTTGSAVSPGYAKGFSINKYGNVWHNGSLPGTSTIAVRTRGGFCWAAFTNTRRNNSALNSDLDRLNWDMVRKVASWQVS